MKEYNRMKHNFHFWVNYPLTIPLMTDADMCLTSSKSKEQDCIALHYERSKLQSRLNSLLVWLTVWLMVNITLQNSLTFC